ncbi:hypothetical protein [Paenibacillus sp.]|uniref:hypothetical protein n=1 Tax=Paenibacillus sp. TaxID=58172 RepID=UPI0028121CFC|nr:hypothetical protein [Paenibacillus sp.]
MQVTIGVKGGARKALFEPVVELAAAAPTIDSRRLYEPKVKSFLGHTVPLLVAVGGALQLSATKVFAAPKAAVEAGEAIPVIGGALKGKIMHAFDPLIDLIVSLSYPVAGVMIAGGCLFIMVGNRDRGMQLLQNAAIGYLLMQLSPLMLDLLVGIGESV